MRGCARGGAPPAPPACRGGVEQALDALAQQARQHRRRAAGGDRHGERRAIHHRRHLEAGEPGVVHHVDENAPIRRGRCHRLVHGGLAGGGDGQPGPVQVRGLEGGCNPANFACRRSGLQRFAQLRCDDRQARAGAQQWCRLACRDRAAADQQDRPIGKFDKQRIDSGGRHFQGDSRSGSASAEARHWRTGRGRTLGRCLPAAEMAARRIDMRCGNEPRERPYRRPNKRRL